jgi:chaperonin GroES
MRSNSGSKYQAGMRVAQAMNIQLLNDMPEWENDTDLIMHILPVIGTCFRKICYDTFLGKIKSEIVLPQFLIIDNDARCFDTANRITQILQLYQYQIKEYVNTGIFLKKENYDNEDEEYDTNGQSLNEYYNNSNDTNVNANAHINDGAKIFIEQHIKIDLDGDGYPEPYIVWIDEAQKEICRIIKRFKDTDIIYQKDGKKIKTIKEERYFVKYSFIPNPESPIYDLGYGDLLEQLNNAVNTTYNLMIDTGHKQVMGGGLISRQLRMKGGTTKVRQFEWQPVDPPIGTQLKDAFAPYPVPQLDPMFLQLLQDTRQQAEEIAVVNKVALGEIPANTPATTILAMIEQSSIQFKAIFKRIHRSLKQEFKRIFELNREYLTDEEYNDYLSTDNEWSVENDFNLGGYSLIPCSDIDCLNNTQQLIKAQILDSYRDDPLMNGIEIRQYILNAVGIKEPEKFIVQPQPQQPDPVIVAQGEALKAQAGEIQMRTQLMPKEVELKEREIMVKEADLKNKTINSETTGIKNLADAESKSTSAEVSKFQATVQGIQALTNNNNNVQQPTNYQG